MAGPGLDEDRLWAALGLAEQAIGLSEPNPRVGCIIGREDGTVLGQGHTQQAGGPHAEVMALADAASRGLDVRGATAWVTLEPCAHHGRTPPCCDALIAAGIGRLVAATEDPFPAVAGSGLRRLRNAGIQVDLAPPEIAWASRELNIGFFSRVIRKRPWVRLKAACSLDGRTALPDGQSQWITGPQARADGHAWRRRASIIVTGIGTVLADDPQLNVRLVQTPRQPLRAVLDSSLRLPLSSRLCTEPGLLVYASTPTPDKAEQLRLRGTNVVTVPAAEGGGVDLFSVLADFAARDINEVHVEGGARLTGAWLKSGLADELVLYVAPSLLGQGPGIATLPQPRAIDAAQKLELVEVAITGTDARLRLRTNGSSPSAWCQVSD
jgi:diaminohydroxyphosphoribosylaminopyrimidine deaminase/5-amino-6-(5-phosphoribosylamino)uracil reductase